MTISPRILKKQAKMAKRIAKRASRGDKAYDLIPLRFFNTPGTQPEDTFILRKDADSLIWRGLATHTDHGRSIRVFDRKEVFGAMGTGFPRGNGRRYDAVGLEKYPIEVLGGLCRTETQPSPISRAPSWRPLH